MHSTQRRRPRFAPERVINSRLKAFWPWVVASAAIHGLLLITWLGLKSSDSATNPADGVVIELVSIDVASEKPVARPASAVLPIQKAVQKETTPRHAIHKPSAIPQPAKKSSPVITTVHKTALLSTPARARIRTMPEQASAQPIQLADNRQISPKPMVRPAASYQATEGQSIRSSKKNDVDKSRRLIRKHLESFKYYPASARRRGIEGHVEVGFTLTHDGAAGQVAVLHGSGYAVLDHAALETVYRAQPFPVENGQYRFSLRFKRL